MSQDPERPTEDTPPPRRSGADRGGRRGRATRRRHPHRPCLNCGDATPGNYCPSCGQRKVDVQVSLRAMLADVLEDQLLLGRRLPDTLKALLFKPGFLTTEHVNGRIVRYITPFRLYLVTSIVFFLLLTSFGMRFLETAEIIGDRMGSVAGDSAALARMDSLLADTTLAPELRGSLTTGRDTVLARLAQADSMAEARRVRWQTVPDQTDIQTGIARLDSMINRRLVTLSRLDPQDAIRTVVRDYLGHVPTAMFILLPLFAIALKVLYVRQGRFYAEHFVFLLHVHAFIFIMFTLLLLLGQVELLGTVLVPVVVSWTLVYLYLALKRVYGQGWAITAVKLWFLGWTYFWMLLLALAFMIPTTLALG